jgi:hypothetical protein
VGGGGGSEHLEVGDAVLLVVGAGAVEAERGVEALQVALGGDADGGAGGAGVELA